MPTKAMANPPQPEMLGGPTIMKLPEIVTCSHAGQRGGYGPNEDLKHWNVTGLPPMKWSAFMFRKTEDQNG